MGIGVSNWNLARTVSKLGHLGVVSGVAIETVFLRRLQDGDPGGHVRRALKNFPCQSSVQEILNTYFLPSGRPCDLSDEEEQSTKAVSDYIDQFKSLKNSGGLLKIYSIVRTKVAPNVSGEVRSGLRYLEASQLSGGTSADITSKDYYQILSDLGGQIVNLTDSFALSHKPVNNNFTVKINGQIRASGWIYDEVSMSIKFDKDNLPAEGSIIEVSYQYVVS